MPLADVVPTDSSPAIRFSPNANTRRVYDRNIYVNDTAFLIPPVVEMIGLPVRVDVDEVTIYGKPIDAVMVDPTGDVTATAGVWYVDIPVSADPDLEPNILYVKMSHPSWVTEEIRLVPAGTGKICWSDLAIATPAAPIQYVFIGGSSGGVSSWNDLSDKPTTFPPSTHSHTTAQVTGLSDYIDIITADKANLVGGKIPTTELPDSINNKVGSVNGKTGASVTLVSADIGDFVETAQDAINALLVGASGVTLSYNDVANTLTITGGGSGGGLDEEAVRDAIGVALVGTGLISIVVNDAADTITISTTATANSTDASLRTRSTHTGTQDAVTTLTNFNTAMVNNVGLMMNAMGMRHTIYVDPVTGLWPNSGARTVPAGFTGKVIWDSQEYDGAADPVNAVDGDIHDLKRVPV